MVRFIELINASLEWTKVMLFKPFVLKKWLLLTFLAMLSGWLVSGGCNFRLPFGPEEKQASTESFQKGQTDQNASRSTQDAQPPHNGMEEAKAFIAGHTVQVVTVVTLVGVIVMALFLFVTWLNARCKFVFIGNIVSNGASFKEPFHRYAKVGNSLFKFLAPYSMVITVVILSILASCSFMLYKTGIFEHPKTFPLLKVLMISLAHILIFIGVTFFSALLVFFIDNFVVMIMFKEDTVFRAAVPHAWALCAKNFSTVIKYLFVKLGLWLCTTIMAGMLNFFVALTAFVPLFCVIVFLSSRSGAHLLWVVVIMILVGLLVSIPAYCVFLCLGLPFAVFLKTFNIKFIGRLDPAYDLFMTAPEKGPVA